MSRHFLTPPACLEGAQKRRHGPRCPSCHLLPHDADHYRTGANHIEFNGCGAAHVDYATSTIRATIYNTDDYCLAVVMVSDPHLRSKRQCAMGGGKSVWAGSFAAGGAPAVIKRCATRFSVNGRSWGMNGGWSLRFHSRRHVGKAHLGNCEWKGTLCKIFIRS